MKAFKHVENDAVDNHIGSVAGELLEFVYFKCKDSIIRPQKILFSTQHIVFTFNTLQVIPKLNDLEIIIEESSKRLRFGYDFHIKWVGNFNTITAMAVSIKEIHKKHFFRYLRFESEALKKAVIRTKDIEFSVKDISETGMLLLSDKNISFFPGTRFSATELTNGKQSIFIDLLVENIKKSKVGYSVGASVTSENSKYLKFIRSTFDFKNEDIFLGTKNSVIKDTQAKVFVSEGKNEKKIISFDLPVVGSIEIVYKKTGEHLQVCSILFKGFKNLIESAVQIAFELVFIAAYDEKVDLIKMCEPDSIRSANHSKLIAHYNDTYIVSNYCPFVGVTYEKKSDWSILAVVKSYFLELFGQEKGIDQTSNSRGFGYKFFVKPRWTEQHLRASVLKPYILAATELIGIHKLNLILDEMGINFDYFKNSNNWVSISFYDEFIKQFERFGNKSELQVLAAQKLVTREEMGLNYYILKHFFSPFSIFKISEVTAPYFNKTRTYRVFNSGLNKCSIEVGVVSSELAPKDSTSCQNWIEIMHCYMRLVTGDRGRVEHNQCIYNGHGTCVYDVQWKTPSSIKSYIVSIVVALICVLVVLVPALELKYFSHPLLMVLPSFIMLCCFFLYNGYQSRKKIMLLKEFERYQTQSDEKYKELQEAKKNQDLSYHESSMLEKLSQEVQMNDNFNGILNQTLKALSEKFDFHRSFVMLVDYHQKKLKTSAVFGESNNLIWHYSVDISKNRDNPMVLSSVYHTGQSVWIEDVEKYLFHFNEESKQLIQSLQTESFCMAPLIGQKSTLGVLVADKGRHASKMTKRDSVLLSRVGRLLGLALDKKAQLESEVLLRKTFEKYVPYKLGDVLSSQTEAVLGGTTSEVICMFIDIRGFTKLSNMYSPNVVIDILNRVFSVVHNVVVESGGTINKYLGDGALVVWGGVTGLPGYDRVLETLNTLEIEVNKISENFKKEGLPIVEVGMGVHCGPAVIGNVGTVDRLEYTVIGSTVNLASRLESLCKEYGTTQVLSEKFLLKTKMINSDDWKRVENIHIKGFSEPINIYIKK